jgi:hypothetical protein
MLVKEVNCPETSIRCPGTILELLGDALWTVERTQNGLCMDSGESTREVYGGLGIRYHVSTYQRRMMMDVFGKGWQSFPTFKG